MMVTGALEGPFIMLGDQVISICASARGAHTAMRSARSEKISLIEL